MRKIRPVSPSDLELIYRHRHEMFREAGRTEADLARMAEPFRRWLAKRLEDGAYFGFVAENAGRAHRRGGINGDRLATPSCAPAR